jgi:hypothetical protein
MGTHDSDVKALMQKHRDELTEEIRSLYRAEGKDVIVDVDYDVNVYPVKEISVQEAKQSFDKAIEGDQ